MKTTPTATTAQKAPPMRRISDQRIGSRRRAASTAESCAVSLTPTTSRATATIAGTTAQAKTRRISFESANIRPMARRGPRTAPTVSIPCRTP